MQYKFDGYNYLVRLEKGELLTESLKTFCAQEKIAGASVSGIGAATAVNLGFYDLNAKQYQWKKLDQLLEIVSLQGALSWDGNQPHVHFHGVLSDADMRTYGGHVKELEVAGTCELFIHIWNSDQLTRSENPDSGLKLLDL